jgi:hypothetical protein
VTYDAKTVLERYKQLQDLPDGEPDDSECGMLRNPSGTTESSCSGANCRSCCVGLVEVMRQVHAQQVELEHREVAFSDMLTQARKLRPDDS